MRHIWSGSITFGLVSVPVQLHSALHSRDISFNLLHRECSSRIRQQTFCPACDRPVERSELVKGYEYAKDRYVLMEESDFEKLEVAASRNIDVAAFVDLAKVDPVYFSRPYYLTPEADSQKAFALLVQAMRKTRRTALVRFVMRGKEYVGCIAPRGNLLLLYVMHHREEVRDSSELESKFSGTLRDKEVTLAQQLVENLTEPFDQEMLRDRYRETLQQILDQKARGQSMELPSARRPQAKVVSLMDALKKSVMETSRAPRASRSRCPPAAESAVAEKKRRKA